MIAKLTDLNNDSVPSVGDLVTTNVYPDLDANVMGSFEEKVHQVTSAPDSFYSEEFVVLNSNSDRFIWRSDDCEHKYEEEDSIGFVTLFFDDICGVDLDILAVHYNSPSRPEVYVELFDEEVGYDDPFIDVDIFIAD